MRICLHCLIYKVHFVVAVSALLYHLLRATDIYFTIDVKSLSILYSDFTDAMPCVSLAPRNANSMVALHCQLSIVNCQLKIAPG